MNAFIDTTEIQGILDAWDIPGCAIAIVHKQQNSPTFERQLHCVGRKNDRGDHVDVNTRFMIASNSKLFTALATGIALKEAGYTKGFDTKIQDVIPQYRLKDADASSKATFRHALSHSTGLPRHDYYNSHDATKLDDLLVQVANMQPTLPLGDACQYHNRHYDLVALIVEQLSGSPFREYVAAKILRPLGLNSTKISRGDFEASGNFAAGYWLFSSGSSQKRDQNLVLPCGIQDDAACIGAGAMYSTVTDMATWLQVLLSGGRSVETGAQCIPKEMLQECMTGIIPFREYIRQGPEIGPATYGLGVWNQVYRGHNLVEHVGSLPGWMSRLCVVPDANLGIFIMLNGSPNGDLAHQEISCSILDSFFGLEQLGWHALLEKEAESRSRNCLADFDAALRRPAGRELPVASACDIVGLYTSPGFHDWAIRSEHILEEPPEALTDLPFLPYLWGEVQPLIWHWQDTKYKMCLQFTVPTNPPRTMLGNLFDIELDIDGSGNIQGFGVLGISGALPDLPKPQGDSVAERSEMYFERKAFSNHKT